MQNLIDFAISFTVAYFLVGFLLALCVILSGPIVFIDKDGTREIAGKDRPMLRLTAKTMLFVAVMLFYPLFMYKAVKNGRK